ncbi:MAG: polyprenyl synthetase family protein [Muribaculaceae bacterium]|jgi:geranylgeranyl diphosphate synthase, type II|nr:polyprenyl synthetase family protein [Muribaculaceae bacterium]
MFKFKEYIDIVNRTITGISLPDEPKGLYQPITYTMALGGKRLRPVLVLMSCDAFGSQSADVLNKAVIPAVGLEMFHNFTLLHDDVMDRSPLRRGKATVHVKWNENTAILSGDAMLTLATHFISQAEPLKPVLDLFNNTALQIYEGQQFDMDFESRLDVSVDEYINMIRLKTSVLLGCACGMGSILAGAGDADCKALYSFGLNIGLAFQLQDDLLDVYGDELTFGKPIGGDIMNNKKTYLLINALNKADGPDKDELLGWINAENPCRDDKISAVTAIYNRLGIRNETESLIATYQQKALDCLDGIGITYEAQGSFRDFVTMLMNRKK